MGFMWLVGRAAAMPNEVATSSEDVVFAFESLCSMVTTMREELHCMSHQMESIAAATFWQPCPSGYGWYDGSGMWFPWQSQSCTEPVATTSGEPELKQQVDTAAACIKDSLAERFKLSGPASRTLSVALGHRSVRNAFVIAGKKDTLRTIGYIGKAADAFRHLWSGRPTCSVAIASIVQDALDFTRQEVVERAQQHVAASTEPVASGTAGNEDTPIASYVSSNVGTCSLNRGLRFSLDFLGELRGDDEEEQDEVSGSEGADTSDDIASAEDNVGSASVIEFLTIDDRISARNAARKAHDAIYDASYEPPGLFE